MITEVCLSNRKYKKKYTIKTARSEFPQNTKIEMGIIRKRVGHHNSLSRASENKEIFR